MNDLNSVYMVGKVVSVNTELCQFTIKNTSYLFNETTREYIPSHQLFAVKYSKDIPIVPIVGQRVGINGRLTCTDEETKVVSVVVQLLGGV